MSMQDDELLGVFLEESREHLGDIEANLLAMESAGEAINEELVNTVFPRRALHQRWRRFLRVDNDPGARA